MGHIRERTHSTVCKTTKWNQPKCPWQKEGQVSGCRMYSLCHGASGNNDEWPTVTGSNTARYRTHNLEWKSQVSEDRIPCVKVTQLCLTPCDPMDCTVCRILQAGILEWVALPSPGDLPNPGMEPMSPALQVDSLPAESPGKPRCTP